MWNHPLFHLAMNNYGVSTAIPTKSSQDWPGAAPDSKA